MVVAAFLLDLHHVDQALLATQMILAILVVHPLGDIINTPVHTIEEEIDAKGIHAGTAHLPLHTTCPYIAGVLRLFTVSL